MSFESSLLTFLRRLYVFCIYIHPLSDMTFEMSSSFYFSSMSLAEVPDCNEVPFVDYAVHVVSKKSSLSPRSARSSPLSPSRVI